MRITSRKLDVLYTEMHLNTVQAESRVKNRTQYEQSNFEFTSYILRWGLLNQLKGVEF